ncbi:MAG TPA: FecR domain-containing protein [Puia sp.]|nr:FecR domain-containing protein [Puia sp.]
MQKLPDELIEKFLSGNCTEEEMALVWNYLRKNPDESYLLKEFEQVDGEAPLPENYKEEMLAYITERTHGTVGTSEVSISDKGLLVEMAPATPADKKVRRLRFVSYGVAAAAILVICKMWLLDQPALKVSGEHLASYEAPKIEWITANNTGKKEMHLTLPDSSKVDLAPGARMRYRNGFGTMADREIHVSGKAFFEVAKDQERPFTLYSEGLRTVVLGTSFFVNANPYSDKVSVKLMTGKVRVSLDDSIDVIRQKDYYLQPGEELVFIKSTHNVAINGHIKHTEEHIAKAAHSVSADTISNWYMFNNQGLADVLDQLSAIYNVDIEYSHSEIKDMYFIGKLEKKDSLSEIIRDIATLNHLSVTTSNGRYIIRKGKP